MPTPDHFTDTVEDAARYERHHYYERPELDVDITEERRLEDERRKAGMTP